MSGTGNRLIGGVFGDTQPSTADDGNISGVYTMPDQYYITQEGGWELQSGHTATGGAISDYADPGGSNYRAHIFTAPGTFTISALSSSFPAVMDVLIVAGGGGGGGSNPASAHGGGGGGAGGVLVQPDAPAPTSAITGITITGPTQLS